MQNISETDMPGFTLVENGMDLKNQTRLAAGTGCFATRFCGLIWGQRDNFTWS